MKKNLFSYFCFFLLASSLFAQDPHQLFYGHWIKKSYVNNLMTKKSTFLLQEHTGEITEMVINKTLGDTILVCFGNSEGAKYPLNYMGNNQAFFEISPSDNISMTVEKEDKSAREIAFTSTNGSVERFIFMYVEGNDFNAVHTWVNQNMLTGNYSTSVEMGMRLRGPQDASVWFNTDGTLTGIPGFDKYEILTHFDDIANFDVVKLMNSQTEKVVWKGWESKNNRLILYNLVPSDDYIYKKDKIYKQLERK